MLADLVVPAWVTVVAVITTAFLGIFGVAKVGLGLIRGFAKLDALVGPVTEMAAQFRTDSGSSLRDVVNRIEQATTKASTMAEQAEHLAQLARTAADALHLEVVVLTRAIHLVRIRQKENLDLLENNTTTLGDLSAGRLHDDETVAANTAAVAENTHATTDNTEARRVTEAAERAIAALEASEQP